MLLPKTRMIVKSHWYPIDEGVEVECYGLERPPIFLFLILVFILAALPLFSADYTCSVFEIPMKTMIYEGDEVTERDYVEYCLYYGTEETIAHEKRAYYSKQWVGFMLVHPVDGRWGEQVSEIDYRTGESGLYLMENYMEEMPSEIFEVINVFGLENPELTMVSCFIPTGTMRVYFHPDYDENRDYYESRLNDIKSHFLEKKSKIFKERTDKREKQIYVRKI